jgi:ornithine carbamoyltransferase
MDLYGRSLLKETDLDAAEFLYLVDLARRLRADKRQGVTGRRLAGRNIALIFEKTSTPPGPRSRSLPTTRAGTSPISARGKPSSATRSR